VDRIYQSATLTIVCTDGVHADAGLPGVQPGSRPNKQIIREVQSLEMAIPLPYMDEVVDMSHWNTRAWTYQERCLSQRLLFLTETQAYFVCGEKVFYEDTIAEGPITGWHLSIVHSRPLRVPRGTYSFRPIYDGGRGFMKPYASHLRFYSRRRISYQSDILDAFRGVLNVINLTHNFKIWQGLPEIYPDTALLWITLTISKRREVAETDLHASPRPVFPSWSWSGWLGEVETALGDDLGFTAAGFQPAVNWYLMNEDGEVIRLETESFVGGQYGDQPPEYFKEELRISNPLPDHLQRKLRPRETALEEKPAWRYPPYLLGWTRCARFKLEREEIPKTDIYTSTMWPTNPSMFRILDMEGCNVGSTIIDITPDVLQFLPPRVMNSLCFPALGSQARAVWVTGTNQRSCLRSLPAGKPLGR
jgi:hypothetical protein